jgi:hypothetical protein
VCVLKCVSNWGCVTAPTPNVVGDVAEARCAMGGLVATAVGSWLNRCVTVCRLQPSSLWSTQRIRKSQQSHQHHRRICLLAAPGPQCCCLWPLRVDEYRAGIQRGEALPIKVAHARPLERKHWAPPLSHSSLQLVARQRHKAVPQCHLSRDGGRG